MNRFTDAAGRVLSTANPLGNFSLYNYDALNRLTTVTDPLNGATAFGYDANGNLLSVTDARNNQTAYTYDNMDRTATRVDYRPKKSGDKLYLRCFKSPHWRNLCGFFNNHLHI